MLGNNHQQIIFPAPTSCLCCVTLEVVDMVNKTLCHKKMERLNIVEIKNLTMKAKEDGYHKDKRGEFSKSCNIIIHCTSTITGSTQSRRTICNTAMSLETKKLMNEEKTEKKNMNTSPFMKNIAITFLLYIRRIIGILNPPKINSLILDTVTLDFIRT